MNSLKLLVYLWLLGLLDATFEGGAIAVKAFIGLASAHAAGAEVPTLDLEQLYYVFIFGAVYHFCTYITEHSLIKSLIDLAKSAGAVKLPQLSADANNNQSAPGKQPEAATIEGASSK